MPLVLQALVALLFLGCATKTPQTDSLISQKSFHPKKAHITSVPFIKQKENHCGPASLAMVLGHAGIKVDVNKIAKQTFTPMKEGTFQTDMISGIRRQKMLAVAVHDLPSLLQEIAGGNPVIIFQNLALESAPMWHYAVANGYDLKGPDIILHSGTNKNRKFDLRAFERSWLLADNWAYVVLPPGELSQTGTDFDHVSAGSGLERLGLLNEAELTYQSILKKWPKSLSALIGLGNISFTRNQYEKSIKYLEQASSLHPKSSMAWHNLANAYGAAGNLKKAKFSATRAMELVDEENKLTYQQSLQNFL